VRIPACRASGQIALCATFAKHGGSDFVRLQRAETLPRGDGIRHQDTTNVPPGEFDVAASTRSPVSARKRRMASSTKFCLHFENYEKKSPGLRRGLSHREETPEGHPACQDFGLRGSARWIRGVILKIDMHELGITSHAIVSDD